MWDQDSGKSKDAPGHVSRLQAIPPQRPRLVLILYASQHLGLKSCPGTERGRCRKVRFTGWGVNGHGFPSCVPLCAVLRTHTSFPCFRCHAQPHTVLGGSGPEPTEGKCIGVLPGASCWNSTTGLRAFIWPWTIYIFMASFTGHRKLSTFRLACCRVTTFQVLPVVAWKGQIT